MCEPCPPSFMADAAGEGCITDVRKPSIYWIVHSAIKQVRSASPDQHGNAVISDGRSETAHSQRPAKKGDQSVRCQTWIGKRIPLPQAGGNQGFSG